MKFSLAAPMIVCAISSLSYSSAMVEMEELSRRSAANQVLDATTTDVGSRSQRGEGHVFLRGNAESDPVHVASTSIDDIGSGVSTFQASDGSQSANEGYEGDDEGSKSHDAAKTDRQQEALDQETLQTRRIEHWEQSLMEKIGEIGTVWLVGEILRKKNWKNVKMLHVGVFLNSENENRYKGFS